MFKYHCSVCDRDEYLVELIKYPFHVVYKNTETEHHHADPESFICLDCLRKDIR